MLQTTFTTEFRYGPTLPTGFPIHLEGKYIAILGMNGSGKTSLLNALFHKNQREKAEGKTQVCLIEATSNISPLVQSSRRTLEQYNDELANAIEESNGRRHAPNSSELANLLLNHNDFTKQVQKLNDYLEYLDLPEYTIQKIPHSFSISRQRSLSGAGRNIIPILAALTDDSIKMVLIDDLYALFGSRLQERLRDLFYDVSKKKQIIVTSHSDSFINMKDYTSNYFITRKNDEFHILRASSKDQLEGLISAELKPVKVLTKAVPSEMASYNRTKVFISYSHKDTKFLNELLPHLKYLEKNKLIDLWSDGKINPGDKWKEEIELALASTRIAILLISIDFLNSPFIEGNELPPLLTAAESKGVKILPVILRPCTLPKNLSQFQAINSPSRPLAKMKRYEREEWWTKVAETIREFITRSEASQDDEQDLSLIQPFRHPSMGKEEIPTENNVTTNTLFSRMPLSIGSSPDFKILTSPVFQTNVQNCIDVNASEQRIEIKNIGKENAYHIYAALFGCETYIVPDTMPQKRMDGLNGYHWRESSGCPVEPRDTITLILRRYRGELDGKQELDGYQLYAPHEPSLYDAMHKPHPLFHSARLTLTYRDRFGNKYAQTFDYDHNKRAWVYLAHPRAIVEDFFDLLSSKDKKSMSGISRNQENERRNVLYQYFFAELLERLRNAHPGITNARKTQPENFYFFGAGKTGYMFNWALTKNGIKTELIINIPGNRTATKKAFDTLYEQRETIEKELGQPLIWDRLEGKESHIFLMRPATIDDPAEELEHTKEWAVETMIKFVDVFKKRIKSL